jgi:hypothetical protein
MLSICSTAHLVTKHVQQRCNSITSSYRLHGKASLTASYSSSSCSSNRLLLVLATVASPLSVFNLQP